MSIEQQSPQGFMPGNQDQLHLHDPSLDVFPVASADRIVLDESFAGDGSGHWLDDAMSDASHDTLPLNSEMLGRRNPEELYKEIGEIAGRLVHARAQMMNPQEYDLAA